MVDEEDREEKIMKRRRKAEKCGNSDEEKKRNRQKRFGREQIATTGSAAFAPSRYQVIHERRSAPMARVRGGSIRNGQPSEVALELHD